MLCKIVLNAYHYVIFMDTRSFVKKTKVFRNSVVVARRKSVALGIKGFLCQELVLPPENQHHLQISSLKLNKFLKKQTGLSQSEVRFAKTPEL